ncbi:uncharacterized protein L201_006862 [Kwoniella dendrophila CBS 6074]|uniref:Transcription factor CBF/NF-Y/archaeal histone domain-containing protein n=1 Tax=Kwoniella dendrophila CBS 6074 TaxID=1295534 RepID=A0AAX4K569_9TREE
MQVGYESSSPHQQAESFFQHEQYNDESMIEEGEGEGESIRPGDISEVQERSDDAQHEEGEYEESEQIEIGIEKPIQKKITKQRQSLAEKQLGTTIFPISRMKKIIKADKDLDNLSNEAVFMISVATEYFIKHFMEEGYTKARLEKRKTVNYKDIAAVVARSEEFDFLKDVIPQPISLSKALERRKQKLSSDENPSSHESNEATTSTSIFPDQQNPSLLNDEDLPPLVNSTNPLFPNAIMKKPPNTHAKTAMPKPQRQQSEEDGNGNEDAHEQSGIEPEQPKITNPRKSNAGRKSLTTKEKEKEIIQREPPKPYTGKNGPSTPHGLTTRGAARRSLAGTDVDMSPVNEIRKENHTVASDVPIEGVDINDNDNENKQEDADRDQRMEE